MNQKGALPIILVITLIGGGLVLGAVYISQRTGFLSDALEGNTQSSLIYIAPRVDKLKTATNSATPSASVASVSASLKPASSSASASPSASVRTIEASRSASPSARLGFPGQPDARIDVNQMPQVRGVYKKPSFFSWLMEFIFN